MLLLLDYQYYCELLKFSIDYLLAQFQFPPHPERSNRCSSTNHSRFTLILHLFIILHYYYSSYFSSFPSSSLSSGCLLPYHFKFCPPNFIFKSYNLDYVHSIVYARSFSSYSCKALVKSQLECYQLESLDFQCLRICFKSYYSSLKNRLYK